MKKNINYKLIAIIALFTSILSLSIAYSAYTKIMNNSIIIKGIIYEKNNI